MRVSLGILHYLCNIPNLPVRSLLHQLARRQHYHHVVVRMPVPSRFRPGREAPFGHDRAVGFREQFGGALGRDFIGR